LGVLFNVLIQWSWLLARIELNQFLVTQQIKSCSIQPRALSITQGRAVGVAHYLLGGIATTWAFFLARSRLIQQYLPLKFPHILWGKQSWGYGHTVVYSGYMGPAIPSSAEFTSARRSCEEYSIGMGVLLLGVGPIPYTRVNNR
jgi:hypothetical protein